MIEGKEQPRADQPHVHPDRPSVTATAIAEPPELKRFSGPQRAAALLAHEKDDLKGAIRLLDDFAISSPPDAVDVLRIKGQHNPAIVQHIEPVVQHKKLGKATPANTFELHNWAAHAA